MIWHYELNWVPQIHVKVQTCNMTVSGDKAFKNIIEVKGSNKSGVLIKIQISGVHTKQWPCETQRDLSKVGWEAVL